MKHISDLPQPHRALAELRRKQDNEEPTVDEIMVAFLWPSTPEHHDFWSDVYNAATADDLPAIPNKSMHDLSDSLERRVRAELRGLRDTAHALFGDEAKHQARGD